MKLSIFVSRRATWLMFSLGLMLAVGAGCGKRQTVRVPDVTKSTSLTLTTDPGQGAKVHKLSLRIRGRIDGTAQLSGAPLQSQRVSGRFEVRHEGDYYATNCVISYLPVGVRDGQVTVDYEFHSMK
jgi:hypothetical protein